MPRTREFVQAGVPVIPIVIHNAIDVLPRGAAVFRPATVDVDILPPVSTEGWSAQTMDEHVTLVRGMFLEALGQAEPAKPASAAKAKTKAKPTAKAKPKARPKARPTAKAKVKV